MYSTQIKSGNQIQFNELNVQTVKTEARLVWTSSDRYIFEESLDEDTKKVNLFLMKQVNQDLVEFKRIESAEAYDITSKSKNDFDFNLVYAKYKENKDLSFNVLNLKNEQKTEHVVNVVSALKDTKSIVEVIFHFKPSYY